MHPPPAVRVSQFSRYHKLVGHILIHTNKSYLLVLTINRWCYMLQTFNRAAKLQQRWILRQVGCSYGTKSFAYWQMRNQRFIAQNFTALALSVLSY